MTEAETLRLDIPVGKNELIVLKATKVGDVRKGLLFSAIPADVDWTCKVATETAWQFEGRFCDMLVAVVDIVLTGTSLVLTLKEEPGE